MGLDREAIRERILQRVQESFPGARIAGLTEASPLAGALGLNSMQVVDLVMGIEEEFSIQVPDRELEKLTTLGSCVDFVARALGDGDPSAASAG
jgi:acyl carrier protein